MANYLIDVDGTICEDIKNEESHRFPDAIPYDNAAGYLHELVTLGHTITYFTSREEKDREVTMLWLKKHGFPVHGLIMNKPRGECVWVDNLPHEFVRYHGEGKWSKDMFYIIKIASEY